MDFSLLNGKGYSDIQSDNNLKTAFGLLISTPNNVFIRIYGDIMKAQNVWQKTLIGFAGIKNNHFSLGIESSYKTNLDSIKGDNVWGVSTTASVFLGKKSEIFARYDYSLNYRHANPYDPNQRSTDMIYLNVHFKF